MNEMRELNKTECGGFKNGTLTIHLTADPVGTPMRRIKPICGQKSRRAFYSIFTGDSPVNCEKCLSAQI